jgi:outer membrane protein, adhesin transport system
MIKTPPQPLHEFAAITKRRRMSSKLLAFGILTALSGCGESPADLAVVSEAVSTAIAQTNSLQAGRSGGAVKLSEGVRSAVVQAVKENDAYRAAVVAEAEASAQIAIARSAREPLVSGNSTIGGLRESGASQGQTSIGAAVGVNVSQLLYDGGESAASVDRAAAQALVVQSERLVLGNELALQVARAWTDVWQYDKRLLLLQTRTSEIGTLVAQIDRLAANGMIDRASVESVRRQIADIDLEEVRLAADRQDARIRFKRYFGALPEPLSVPAELISVSQAREAVEVRDWQQAPVLRRAAAELLGARSSLVSAQAALGPRAVIQAGIQSPTSQGDSTDTSIGVALQYTFGDGGRRRAQIDAAQARVNMLDARLSEAQATLSADIDTALARLTAIEHSMPLMEDQLRLSEAEAETARSQLATGQSSIRQLVEAEIATYRARDRQIAMQAEKVNLQLAIASLTGALGRVVGLDASETP